MVSPLANLINLLPKPQPHLVSHHPDYSKLAARICVDDLHRSTKDVFTDVITDLREYIDPESKKHAPLISEEVYDIIMANAEVLNNHIDYNRDFNYDYFGFKTLERSYLLRLDGAVAERPQHMLMRVAVGIHHGDIEKALRTYDLMSNGYFTHATPTLFNSGTPMPQMSSCFLLTMQDDSLHGIYDTLKQCALISKSAGGIGLSIHHIRAKDPTSREPTEPPTELFQCSVFSTILHDTSTRVAVSEGFNRYLSRTMAP